MLIAREVRRCILAALLSVLSIGHAFAQGQAVRMLSRDEACADIDTLLYMLSEVHPNMFSVCGQGELFGLAAHAKSTMPDSISAVGLFKVAAPIVAKIGDGHTTLYFPYSQYFTRTTQRMPLYMRATTDHRLLVESCLDDKIPQGAEVVAINGISSAEMVRSMLVYASGERDFYRIERVNNDMKALFELLFRADGYRVDYRLGNGKTQRLTLPTANYDVLIGHMPRRQQPEPSAPYSFTVDRDKSVAVMDFHSFSDPDGMAHFADSMFTALWADGIKRLIIDVRNNGGGDSRVGDTLLSYLSSRPYTQWGKTLVRVTPTTRRLMGERPMLDDGWYYSGDADENLLPPRSKEQGRFDGKVYLLTSHHAFSSASSFAWAFRQFGMGVVVGEETGGMNVSYGDVLTFRLSNSGLQCGVSYKRFWLYGADEGNIHGTLPDVPSPAAKAMDVALGL